MERTVSVDEKIRRAEEIYSRRQQENTNRVQARVNVNDDRKDYKLFKKMILQIAICLVIYFIFYLIKNSNYIFSENFLNKTKEVLSYDINLQSQYEYVMNLIKNKNDIPINEIQTMQEENQTEEENQDVVTIQEQEPQTQIDTLSVTEQSLPEECSSLSQPQTDAEDIKQKYSLIKPLTGTISSRFGLRNPTTETVPKYHTGIDIAANTGTVFVAAMEGKVILVSSQGDYGNHIKIQKDDVITLYAHCHKIYVTEGQEIVQGQELGEVGATGNVTGAHLHFEVRKNENLVNPDDLLDF